MSPGNSERRPRAEDGGLAELNGTPTIPPTVAARHVLRRRPPYWDTSVYVDVLAAEDRERDSLRRMAGVE